VHAEWSDDQQKLFVENCAEFERITDGPAPLTDPAVRAWLTERLPEEIKRNWKRSERTGLLSIEAAEIKKMALDWPEVRPLQELRKVQKRISTFGHSLINKISPVTGRLHTNYNLPMITGRMSSSNPNLQDLPKPDARVGFRAPEGKILLDADLNQIELRVAAETSGDESMRAAFAAGEDLHDRFAAMMHSDYEQLPKDSMERAFKRKLAKAGHFGNLFAQTPNGFRNYAWKSFDLELSMSEVNDIQSAFYEMYPRLGPYQQEQFRIGKYGTLYSVAGRPRRAIWEPESMMWLQLCANYAIQSSAADVLLEAIYRVDKALPGTLVAAVHDELLCEVDEDQAERAERILREEMTAAFLRWFPQASTLGLVKIQALHIWSDAT
jgi:DNA polymerase I-like protein with 3'-5' exonuclease and polymerase domains